MRSLDDMVPLVIRVAFHVCCKLQLVCYKLTWILPVYFILSYTFEMIYSINYQFHFWSINGGTLLNRLTFFRSVKTRFLTWSVRWDDLLQMLHFLFISYKPITSKYYAFKYQLQSQLSRSIDEVVQQFSQRISQDSEISALWSITSRLKSLILTSKKGQNSFHYLDTLK